MTKEEFSSLFPKIEIKYKDKTVATVKPIPISDVSKITHVVLKLIQNVRSGISVEQLPLMAAEDLLELIPYSIDVDINDLPSILLPDIFKAMIALNLDDTVIKNWLALFEAVSKRLPEELKGKITASETGQDSGK